MKDPKVEFDRQELIALVTDVYVAGFMDGRKTAWQEFDRDMVLSSAFKAADGMADKLLSQDAEREA